MTFPVEIVSKLNKRVTITNDRWEIIAKTKHPIIAGKEKEVREALENPDEIRQSNSDSSVYLYYKKIDKYSLCAVTKHVNGHGFIVTAYLTDRIKEGKLLFKR